MKSFSERKRAARQAGDGIVWEAKSITVATSGGPEHTNATGPKGTDWATSLRGGQWTVHHVPTGGKVASSDCPLIAAMLVQALAIHFPRVGMGNAVEAGHFVAGFMAGAERDPDIEGTQALVLTALMNRRGLAVFMGDPSDPGAKPGGLATFVDTGKDVN